ncbi:MAG TPA: hypothetical protein VNT55_16495 [Baekduia sp.]|nr:hypothetical protein [Baekduia sp.]
MSDYTVLRRAILAALAEVDPLGLRDTGIDLRSEYEMEADHVAQRAISSIPQAREAAP